MVVGREVFCEEAEVFVTVAKGEFTSCCWKWVRRATLF